MRIIKKRSRFFFAVEGESEQSFIKWLQLLADEANLGVHLHVFVLGGGGFKSMLAKAVHERERYRRTKGLCRGCFLLVDGDRENEGDWSTGLLKIQAAKQKFAVCIQQPNFEGILVRLQPGSENKKPRPSNVLRILRQNWPGYQKPENAESLRKRFTLADLCRVASCDQELDHLLKQLGFRCR